MGTYLTSIDPGVHSLGVACFTERVLKGAYFLENDQQQYLAEMVSVVEGDSVISEQMQAYAPGQQKGDQADILHVNITVGALMQHTVANKGFFQMVYPRTWKGNVPKEVMLNRIMSKLTEAEKKLLPKLPKTKLHNVIDAIGIGLWKLERL